MKCINVDLQTSRVSIGVGRSQVNIDSPQAKRWLAKSKEKVFQVQFLGSDVPVYYLKRSAGPISSVSVLKQISAIIDETFQ